MANAAVTITGTPENPIFNFDIPQGEKGDPGGLISTALTTQDLNTVTSEGLYRHETGGTLANHYPYETFYGNVEVIRTRNGSAPQPLTQRATSNRATDNGPRTIYQRSLYTSGVWTPWRSFNSTRVDQTAGRAIYQWDDLNNREQLIYGDTGNRRIESIIANGWVAGAVVLRRIGNTVSISGYYVNSSTATDDVWIQVSPGFRPMLAGTALAITKSTNVMATLSIDPATGNCAFPGRSAVYGLNGHFNASWTTNDPWPTTLPGTASGTIPNL